MEYNNVTHTFSPVYNAHSRILILGTFPSVKSRENQFYYGHPQNRFWKVLAALTKSPLPEDINGKKELLLTNGIAAWDVIESCQIAGSSDSSIRDVVPNDIGKLLKHTDIRQIFANGQKAYDLYMRYIYPETGRKPEKLPSTSPANAAFRLERLIDTWGKSLGPHLSER